MKRILPLQGLRYDSRAVGDLSEVIAPRWPEMPSEGAPAPASEHSAALLVAEGGTDGVDRYAAAAKRAQDWSTSGALRLDEEPAIYVYAQRYRAASGETIDRRSVIALVRLEDSPKVAPVEKSLPGAADAWYRHLESTRVNVAPVVAAFSDPERRVDEVIGHPQRDAVSQTRSADGVRHTLWRFTEPEVISTFADLLAQASLAVVDGCDVLSGAYRFRDEMRKAQPEAGRDAPFEFVPMVLFNEEDLAPALHAPHRLVHDLPGWDHTALRTRLEEKFRIADRLTPPPTPAGARIVDRSLLEGADHGPCFGVGGPGIPTLMICGLKPDLDAGDVAVLGPDRESILDATALQGLVFEELLNLPKEQVEEGGFVEYANDTAEALRLLQQGDYQACFFLPAPPARTVFAEARAGRVLPPRSATMIPPVPMGLIMRTV